ncbi:MAG TPA: glycosyltransferase family 4 protein [Myxococcales bacterium]|jgi:glycosyltransferase involved in cell wall biosynthesis
MVMGVGMLAGVFVPSVGGIQTHTLQLSRRLVALGVEVHVLTRHYPGLARQENIDGVQVHRVGDSALPRGIRVGSYLAGAFQALHALKNQIHVVHAHQLLGPALVGWLARAFGGKPLLLNPHSPDEVGMLEARKLFGRLHLAALRRYGDGFVSICDPIAKELARAGIDPSRIHPIPNGVDTDVFRPATADERAKLRHQLALSPLPAVVYSGRLARVKGVDVLLEAWPRLETQAQLVIVGDGEEAEGLRTRAATLRNVRFAGRVDDPGRWLRAADVAVLPSRGEGLSVALLEAMACGVPTVATAVGGSPGAIADGVDGLLVPPEDPQALADALLRASRTPALGVGARRRVVERHSMDAIARQFVGLYQELCAATLRRDSRPAEAA